MRNDRDRLLSVSRRAALLGAGKILVLGLVGARLYQLQVVESEKYRTLAKENRIDLHLVPPSRGLILDRHGRPLARNREVYRINLLTHPASGVAGRLDRLSRVIPVDDETRRRIMEKIAGRPGPASVTVRESLDWQDVARVEVNAPELSGVSIEIYETRSYPYDDGIFHALGYVSGATAEEIRGQGLYRVPHLLTGKNGIERTQERRLRGRPGSTEVEVNARGRIIRELSRREPQAGDDVALSLDLDLQMLANAKLSGKKAAAAVLLDVSTGEILAHASVPSFDPNAFVGGLSEDGWTRIRRNPLHPMIDRAVSGLYAPGSTFKTVVALAALEAGLVDRRHEVRCSGWTELGGHRFHCWRRGGHGRVDMDKALVQSCDIYFYDMAGRLGPDRIADMARRLGFGAATGLEVGGEKEGIVPSRAWKKARLGEPWYAGETLNYGIGQGFVLATPLQLAVMTARVANGRRAVAPRLLRATAPDGSEFPELGISEDSLRTVRRALFRVCNTRRGTAYGGRIAETGLEMAGKTGTSQVRRISRAERETRVLKNEERPWEERDHGLFVGYAPAKRPKFAVAVVVEHGGSSRFAVPIARDLLLAAQKRPVAPERPTPAAGGGRDV